MLWSRGPSTVRAVHDVIGERRTAQYTTILKLLQIMDEKGLVKRDESQRAHVYRAAITKQRTQKRYVADMVERLFNGSPSQLVLQALGSQPSASREELKEIRALLKRMDTGES